MTTIEAIDQWAEREVVRLQNRAEVCERGSFDRGAAIGKRDGIEAMRNEAIRLIRAAEQESKSLERLVAEGDDS